MNAIFGNKQVSKREYDIVAHRNVFITMRDGVNIKLRSSREQSTDYKSVIQRPKR